MSNTPHVKLIGDKRRAEEVTALLVLILPYYDEGRLTVKEMDFLQDMNTKAEKYGRQNFVTDRQLFWLRDIKDRLIQGEYGKTVNRTGREDSEPEQ